MYMLANVLCVIRASGRGCDNIKLSLKHLSWMRTNHSVLVIHWTDCVPDVGRGREGGRGGGGGRKLVGMDINHDHFAIIIGHGVFR